MTNEPDFDKYAHRYDDLLSQSIKVSGYSTAYFDEYKIRAMHDFLRLHSRGPGPQRILNYGCGIGKSEPYIRHYFPETAMYGVDVSPESIEVARKNNSGIENLYFSVYDGQHMPYDPGFDIIFVAGVLHHIERHEHGKVLRELNRLLDEKGHLFIFEHNPYNPLTRKVVRECPFDEGVTLLAPGYLDRILADSGFQCRIRRFIVFFPSVLRPLQRFEKYLGRIPVGAQYYTVAQKE